MRAIMMKHPIGAMQPLTLMAVAAGLPAMAADLTVGMQKTPRAEPTKRWARSRPPVPMPERLQPGLHGFHVQ
jgi:hypothetical protein